MFVKPGILFIENKNIIVIIIITLGESEQHRGGLWIFIRVLFANTYFLNQKLLNYKIELEDNLIAFFAIIKEKLEAPTFVQSHRTTKSGEPKVCFHS